MFRIRRIYDEAIPTNRDAIARVKEILNERFPDAPPLDAEQLAEKLRNPFKQRFRSVLFVAEGRGREVIGFAILLHEPQMRFCFLDYIATPIKGSRGGVGGALYERVRSEARALGALGMFFECLPDTEQDCPNEASRGENAARLRFYEHFGARPIIGTKYEMPISPGDTCMPYLVFDALDHKNPLERRFAKRVVRAVLERKYAELCPPDYVDQVVASFSESPVELRPPRYVKPQKINPSVGPRPKEPIAMLVNDQHDIHHVKDKGYVESPVRIGHIVAALERTGAFERVEPVTAPLRRILDVHDGALVKYLKQTCQGLNDKQHLYPYVFPVRNRARPPKDSSICAGYYCIDTFTPLTKAAWPAAKRAVDCALTGARELVEGRRLAYALVRPPGHHAERSVFGGFCYFNNGAIAAQYLSSFGKVAILDIDYHHGNGQQDIFYLRSDVLTVSIHGHPRFAYPYFSGFEEERGEGPGEGFNLNLPQPESRDGAQYRPALHRAMRRIDAFGPMFLIVALGLDTAKGDPTGTWSLSKKDFQASGRIIGEHGLHTLVVQEGGYRNKTLGGNAAAFFTGLVEGQLLAGERSRTPKRPAGEFSFRTEPQAQDAAKVRALVEGTGMFHAHEVAIAQELVLDRLEKGESSGNHFHFATSGERLLGYTCFGPIAGTASSWRLHWIAVHPETQGKGLGRKLLEMTDQSIARAGGKRVYIETSHRAECASTRAFYQSCGFELASVLDDFYGPKDAKVTYCRALES